MSTFTIVQAVVLAMVLLASLVTAFRKLLPRTAKRVQARLSASLDRSGRSLTARHLGRWLQPSEAKSGGCGSGDGCGSCGGCAPAAAPVEPMPLKFRSHS